MVSNHLVKTPHTIILQFLRLKKMIIIKRNVKIKSIILSKKNQKTTTIYNDYSENKI